MPHRHATLAGDRQPGLDLLEVGPAILGMPEPRGDEPLLGLLVGAVQRDRGHVPVQPGDLQPEGGDRVGPTEPTMASSLGAIASRARPIRSSLSASGEMAKTSSTAHAWAQSSTRRSGVGESAGWPPAHRSPARGSGWLPPGPDRPDPRCLQVKALAEAGHHWQRPQQLLDAGRAVAGRLPAGSLSRHRGTLADPKPHQRNNSAMVRSTPTRSAPPPPCAKDRTSAHPPSCCSADRWQTQTA